MVPSYSLSSGSALVTEDGWMDGWMDGWLVGGGAVLYLMVELGSRNQASVA